MSYLSTVILLSIFIVINEGQSIIAPTSISNNIENYINSAYNGNATDYFSSDTINCNTAICNIECDASRGCESAIINAGSVTTTLNVTCNAALSCDSMEINADSNMTNINIKCNYANEGLISSDGSCRYLTLNAMNTRTTDLYCNTFNCYGILFYLTNALSASLTIEGGNTAMYGASIYAENLQNRLDIICNGQYVCKGATFYTTAMPSDVSLSCTTSRSCESVKIEAGTMTGNVAVTCQGGGQSCYLLGIYAADMSGSVTMDCLSGTDCKSVTLFCPESCTVNCMASYSCQNSHFWIANHFDYTINLYGCNETATTCSGTDIICADTQGRTEIWQSGCGGDACCPFRSGTIVCAADLPCNITCTDQECRGYYIDATQATSLVLYCRGNYVCEGIKVDCPSIDNTSCFINCYDFNSCSYAQVAASDNIMDEFKLYCGSGGNYACRFMLISLNAQTISNVNISCIGQQSCQYARSTTQSIIGNTEIHCIGVDSCQYSDFSFPTSLPTTAIPTSSPTTSLPTGTPTTTFPTSSPTTSFPTSSPTTSAPTLPTTATPTSFPTFSPTTSAPTFSPITPIPTSLPTTSPTPPPIFANAVNKISSFMSFILIAIITIY